jgi:hypothetical protein
MFIFGRYYHYFLRRILSHTALSPLDNTGHTQKNGAVSIVFTIETAPFFYVYPV